MTDSQPRSGLAAVTPGEAPTAAALWTSIGGVRGLVESLLPGLVFLVTFALTRQTVVSVVAPVVVAVAFLVVRIVQRSNPQAAIAGVVGVAISAVWAIFSGNANDSFIPGMIINAVFLAACLITLLVAWPLVGLFAGALTQDLTAWRGDLAKRRTAATATWVWAGLFGVRLAAELPLYFAQATEALAVVKLVLGVPLYAGALWITWLLLRSAWGKRETAPEE
jgi:hypothetical protein